MSIQIYGVQFRCDLCEVLGNSAQLAEAASLDWNNMPCPAGWTSLHALSVLFKDFYGAVLQHLCPDCSELSIGEMAARLQLKMTKEKADAEHR